MGQYHFPVNLDKKEFLHPHKLGDGCKIKEQGAGQYGTAAAVCMLLTSSLNRGGGDWREDNKMAGRWVGDRVVWLGDYSEDNDIPGVNAREIFKELRPWRKTRKGCEYKDISDPVAKELEKEYNFKFKGKDGTWREKEYPEDSSSSAPKPEPEPRPEPEPEPQPEGQEPNPEPQAAPDAPDGGNRGEPDGEISSANFNVQKDRRQIEIYCSWDHFPSAVAALLRASGFRYDEAQKCWTAPSTPANRKLAATLRMN